MEGKVEAQSYSLPGEMSGVVSATIAETSQGEVILCHDASFLFAARVVRGGGNVTFQKFALASVSSLAPVIKNYFMAVLESRRLVVFEVGFNEDGKIMLRFIFNRERPFASTFLREVAPNMAELHICFPDNEIVVHQFTVNGKVGVMTYLIGAQNKLEKCDRAQLYASKSMVCANRRCIYYFANFSTKVVSSFNLAKLQADLSQNGAFPLAYVSKQEDFYLLLSNFTVVNVMNTSMRHRIYCEEKQNEVVQRLVDPKEVDRFRVKDGSGLKVSTYLDMVLVEDGQRAISYIFHVKPKGSSLIGLEYGKINWFWTGSRKLVGLSHDRTTFKIIDEIRVNDRPPVDNPFLASLHAHSRKDYKVKEGNNQEQQASNFSNSKVESPPKNTHSAPGRDERAPLVVQKSPQKSQQALQMVGRFKPMKIIQKNKVSVSKTVHKSKEIQPISQEEEANHPKQEETQPNAEPEPQKAEPQKVQPTKEEERLEQRREGADAQIQKNVEEQCQKMANAVLDQDSPSKQPAIQQEEAAQQPQKDSDEASCEEVQQKNEGDVYPKEDSELSDSIIVPGKQQGEQEQKEQEQPSATSNPIPVPKQEEMKQGQESLPKSLAVLIGKSSLGGQYSHPLNLFSTSINRNNIFGSILRHEAVAADPSQLRRYHSEDQYYNPFTSSSPCSSPTKPKQPEESEQPPKEDSVVQRNAQMLRKVKELFQETTGRLLKAVDEVANLKSSQPYLKDKMVEELRRGVRQVMERMMVGEFTSRIQRYFYEVFRQTDQVQQQSIKFYKAASNHRASNVETHLNNQEKLIRQIRDIESNLRFCISHLKDNTRATFEALMRDWQTQAHQTRRLVDAVTAARVKVEAEEQARERRYEQTKQTLDAIKILLAERISMEGEKRQRKIDRERQKQVDRESKAKKEKKRRGEKKAVRK